MMSQSDTASLSKSARASGFMSRWGILVKEADQVYAERLHSDPTLLLLSERLRLDPKHLELVQEPEAGRPAVYYHRMILAVF